MKANVGEGERMSDRKWKAGRKRQVPQVHACHEVEHAARRDHVALRVATRWRHHLLRTHYVAQRAQARGMRHSRGGQSELHLFD